MCCSTCREITNLIWPLCSPFSVGCCFKHFRIVTFQEMSIVETEQRWSSLFLAAQAHIAPFSHFLFLSILLAFSASFLLYVLECLEIVHTQETIANHFFYCIFWWLWNRYQCVINVSIIRRSLAFKCWVPNCDCMLPVFRFLFTP